MSEFDKEAERQKLREKYERDREKRKETERMSQLLLQGATMTNRHCDTCGDPLFRYEGNEFCATCEGRTQEAAQQNAATQQHAESATADGERDASVDAERAEPTDVDDDAAGHPSPATAASPEGADTSTERQPSTTPGGRDEPTPTPTPDSAGTGSATDATTTKAPPTTPSARSGDADLAAARESLVRTITHHAQRAEAVDGPRGATDHLAAVREAAEALAALDRSQR